MRVCDGGVQRSHHRGGGGGGEEDEEREEEGEREREGWREGERCRWWGLVAADDFRSATTIFVGEAEWRRRRKEDEVMLM